MSSGAIILIVHEMKAPLFRGRPDFVLSQSYGSRLRKLVSSEIGFYFDELTNRMVRVLISPNVPLRDSEGKNITGFAMEQENFVREHAHHFR